MTPSRSFNPMLIAAAIAGGAVTESRAVDAWGLSSNKAAETWHGLQSRPNGDLASSYGRGNQRKVRKNRRRAHANGCKKAFN